MEEVNMQHKIIAQPRKAFWEIMRGDLDSWKDKSIDDKKAIVQRWIADAPLRFNNEDMQIELLFWKELYVLLEVEIKKIEPIFKEKLSKVTGLLDKILEIHGIRSMLETDSDIRRDTKMCILSEMNVRVEQEDEFQTWFGLLDFLTHNKIDNIDDILEKDPKIPNDAKRWIKWKMESHYLSEIEEKSEESLAARESLLKNLSDQLTSANLEVDEVSSTLVDFDRYLEALRATFRCLEYEEPCKGDFPSGDLAEEIDFLDR